MKQIYYFEEKKPTSAGHAEIKHTNFFLIYTHI